MPGLARKPLPKPNPESDPRFRKVMEQLKAGAAKTKTHPPAGKKAAEAAKAAKGPPNERLAAGKAKQVDKIKEAKEGKPEPASFLAILRAEIAKAMPQTLGATDNFDQTAQQMKGGLKGNVSQQKETSTQDVSGASKQTPSPAGEAKAGGAVPGEPAPGAPPINAPEGMPAPKSDADVSLQDSKQDTDAQMKEAEVTPQQLQKANDPRFSSVLEAKTQVARQADAAPAQFRGQERATLSSAGATAQSESRRGAAAMIGVRGGSNVRVLTRQQQQKAADEKKRLEVVAQIETIFTDTKTKVDQKLASLDTEVGAMFDQGTDAALNAMTSFVNTRMRKYKIDRYLSIPVVGAARWIRDQFAGLPDEVNVFYEQGRQLFQGLMDNLVVRVAALVERRLKEAKDEVARGQAAIKKLMGDQPKALQQQLQQTVRDVTGRFAELEKGIEDKKNQLAQALAAKYKEAFDKANEALKKIQDENKGLVAGFIEKLAEVIKALMEFKDKLMAILRKGAETIKLIIADPLGFLSNLIAAVKGGIQAFVGNIWAHLKKGFMTWLFGALSGAGIEIPSDLSLPSILKLVLGVLGITYDRMRAKAVKLIGERNVKIIEKLVEYIRALITGGPAALWEKVKEDLSSLKAMVIDAIQNWLIETVVKQAVAKIVSMFNPAGAIIQAIIAIYNIVMFVVEKAQQIMAFVEAVVNSVHAIATGAIGGAIAWIEQALARTIPIVIGFLARLIGLGGISQKIKDFILKVQAKVDAAIDKAIAKVVAFVKKLFGKGSGPGGADREVGEQVSFSSGGESHRLWIDKSTGEVMVASSAAAVKSFLASKSIKDAVTANPPLGAKVSAAAQLAGQAKVDAQKVLQAQAEQQANGANAVVKTKEQRLAALLIEIIAGASGDGAIFQVLGKPIDPIPKAPEGYVFKTILGFKEIERGAGRGGSGRGSFPEVHVDQPGTVQPGLGRRRSDNSLITAYLAAIAAAPKNNGDEQPNVLGSPNSLISDLDQRIQARRHPMADGIRAQMKRIIEVVKGGQVLTGVEVQIGGGRSVDYTTVESGKTVLVEYKHWTGKLSPKRRNQLTTRLRTQLSAYITKGQNKGYDMVVVEFKSFGSLDAASQTAFRGVFTQMKALARSRSRAKSKTPIEFDFRI
jgi:uncharacterized lipoprotein YmbA